MGRSDRNPRRRLRGLRAGLTVSVLLGLVIGLAVFGATRSPTSSVRDGGSTVGSSGSLPRHPPIIAPTIPGPAPEFIQPPPRLQFTSSSVGWMVPEPEASPGQVLQSSDRGRSWQTVYNSTMPLLGVDFVTDNTGWVLGLSTLIHTTDWGIHWSSAGEPAVPLAEVDFVDATNGFGLIQSGGLVRTSDGGQSWVSMNIPVSFDSMCFRSPAEGLGIAGETVYKTTDYGQSWTSALQAPVPGQSGTDRLSCNGAVAAATFVAGNEREVGSSIYTSTDGGSHWQSIGTPGKYPLELHGRPETVAPDGTVVFVANGLRQLSSGPTISTEANGGFGVSDQPVASGAMTQQGTGATFQAEATSFLSSSQGWVLVQVAQERGAVLSDLALFATTDGGRSWTEVWTGE